MAPPNLARCQNARESSLLNVLAGTGFLPAFERAESALPMDENEFEPRLGRMRSRGKGGKYVHRVLASANLARGGPLNLQARRSFSGSRIGRGSGVGRILASRDRLAAYRRRRVIIKTRLVRLAGKGVNAAHAHLRYLERDGTTREGNRGALYDPDSDQVDGKAFLARGQGDRHQFRFIVSAEDGVEYEDLKPLTRRLMARMEEDLGTGLDWVAVDHFNTAFPHSHVILRGKDENGDDLIIARDYIRFGVRERAAELVTLDLGPRSDRTIQEKLRAEVEQERLTSIDRALLRGRGRDGRVDALGRNSFDHSIRLARLRQLERMGLAVPEGGARWTISGNLDAVLTRLGERGDIVRTMQRALRERAREVAATELAIVEPGDNASVIGRIVARGLSDELEDRHHLIVEAIDGRVHFVPLGRGDNAGETREGAIVRADPVRIEARESDRTVAAVAAVNGGRYDVDAHLRFDPNASEAFALTHVRRLEAMRRLTGAVERSPDGSWIVAPDHLERAAAYEAVRARDHPVTLALLSDHPLESLIEAETATWLDRELTSKAPLPVRDSGFGSEVMAAKDSRRRWLIEEGLAEEQAGVTRYKAGLLAMLQRRELTRIAGQLSDELGLAFAEHAAGDRLEGILRRRIDGVGGRFALIERSHEFTLAPWRPILDSFLGKKVSGIVREGGISWTLGRQRGGPDLD
jgi:type IV secretory pathway VirD2 relaxase